MEQAVGFAYQVKMEALARLGELLKAMPKAMGGEQYHTRPSTGANKEPVPTYADLGLGKKEAMIAQQLAALPKATGAAGWRVAPGDGGDGAARSRQGWRSKITVITQ